MSRMEELEDVTVEREVWGFLLGLLPLWAAPGSRKWKDRWNLDDSHWSPKLV